MTLRSQLSELINLLDAHPEIDVKTAASTLINALKGFESKFKVAVQAKEADRKWQKLRNELLKLTPEQLGRELGGMDDKTLMSMCKFFGMKSVGATKKPVRTPRENAEFKVIKKLKEISKQLH